MKDYTKLYINGEWIAPSGGTEVDLINPATERAVGRISLATSADVDVAVKAARHALKTFSLTTREERIALLSRTLEVYATRHKDLADALTAELGAPIKFAMETQAGVGFLHLQTAIEALKTYVFEYPQSDRTTIRREPIGVVGMITPWNWPINQVMCKVVPALATGNTMVHKPSEIAPMTAHIIAEILHEAGVPKGVYNLVDGDGPTVGAAIASHPGIDMVSFTGSTSAGIDVARRAADSVKRVHQELGGKSPNVILDDADLTKAITENIYRLMLNSGQTCHAPTRMLVPAAKMEEAKRIAAGVVATVTCGDPTTEVYMGPLVSERQWNRVQGLIRKGIDEGATLVAGGLDRPAGLNVGYYVKPTIFADVSSDMTIAREEIFAPVLAIIGYKDVDDAVAIANDTPYGLGAFVQAGTDERANEIAARIEAGMVYINGAGEDANAPFGGYKMSGNGREWGEIAFTDFLETKAVIHRTAA